MLGRQVIIGPWRDEHGELLVLLRRLVLRLRLLCLHELPTG
jgi:hypothetical protein